MQLNVEALSVPLSTQLLHCGAGRAEHQLQVCLRGGGRLRARGGWLRVNCAAIQTHTAPLGVPLEPVPLSWSKPGLSRHTAAAPIALYVALLTQRESFQYTNQHQIYRSGRRLPIELGCSFKNILFTLTTTQHLYWQVLLTFWTELIKPRWKLVRW